MSLSGKVQIWCVWCGPVFAVIFFIGMLLAGLLPPPGPTRSAAQVAAFYRGNPTEIRLGLMIMMLAAGLTIPFTAALAILMRRIEGRECPMTIVQVIGGALGAVAILVPVFLFTAAAFRPGRSPELIQALDDAAWLPFVMNYPPALLQVLSVAVVILLDRSRTPIFPRWVGYYNIWVAVAFIPGGLATFFQHGVFAWNGLLAFWLAAVEFGSWYVVMAVAMRRAVRGVPRMQREVTVAV